MSSSSRPPFRCVSLLRPAVAAISVLCGLVIATGPAAGFDNAKPSQALLDLSAQDFLGGPSPASGFDFHDRVCLIVDNDRFRIATNSEVQRVYGAAAQDGGVVYRPGMAFLTTDLCAMGHSAKDAPLLMDLAVTHDAAIRAAAGKLVDGRTGRATGLPAEVWDAAAFFKKRQEEPDIELSRIAGAVSKTARPAVPLRHIVYGNLCMTPDPSFQGGNKRTATWHQVVFPWFRAVVAFLNDAIELRTRDGGSAAGGNEPPSSSTRVRQPPLQEYFAAHFARNRVEAERTYGGPMCFERVAVRHERYRWMKEPGGLAVAAFRSALYSHFGTNTHHRQIANRLASAHGDDHAHTRRPLIVTILVRDEDRHFNEAAVVDYLQQLVVPHLQRRLSTHCDDEGERAHDDDDNDDFLLPRALLPHACRVWDARNLTVRAAKFDNIRGSKGAPPPTPAQQLQILYDTDIFMAAHGAGLAAVLLMRPGAAVVEFIPHNFAYYMYEEAALVASVHYRAFTSRVVHPARCCKPAPAAYGGSAAARWLADGDALGASAVSESPSRHTAADPSLPTASASVSRCQFSTSGNVSAVDGANDADVSRHRAVVARRSGSSFTEAFHINGVGARPCKFCDIALDASDLLEVFAEMFRLVTWSRVFG